MSLASAGRRVSLTRSRRRFWLVMTVLLVLLGLTRQLDLQALVAQLARGVAHGEGLYDERSGFQLGCVIAIGVLGTIGLGIALVTFRRAEGSVLLAMAGAVLLVTFTVIRTVSFHDIDRFLRRGVPHAQLDNLIEIGTLALIACGSLLFGRLLREEREGDRIRALSIKERRRQLGERRRARDVAQS